MNSTIYNFFARYEDKDFLKAVYKRKGLNNEYNKQALDFLKDTKTLLSITYLGTGKHFAGDKINRDIYSIQLKNSKHSYLFNFGDSIVNTKKNAKGVRVLPTPYDILACLSIDYSEDFEDFCNNFGYDKYNSEGIEEQSMKIYLAVKEETNNLEQLFTEEQLELLHEIA